jgi:hypothetical protein
MSTENLNNIEAAINNPHYNGKINMSIWALTVTGFILKEIHINEILTAVSLITATAASLTTVLVQLKAIFNKKNKSK